MIPALALLALLTAVETTSAQVGKLYPVDEAAEAPDFFAFRAHLIQVVVRRDTAALYASLAPDVLNSFGGGGGVAEFRAQWRPDEADSDLWRTLADVLSLGGTFDTDTLFAAPYTFGRFPPALDPFDHVVAVGSNVPVRAEPKVGAAVLATVAFDVLPIARNRPAGEDASGWEAVRLSDGRLGLIEGRFLRSPVGYRATFVRREGRWLIRALVAGD